MIPINVDRNVSIRDYDKLPADSLLVTSTFLTIQGEGPFAGKPALFIRLAGCNIGAKKDCPWCDTRFNFDEGMVVSVPELAALVRDAARTDAPAPVRLVVVTGGEPLLQKRNVFALEKLVNGGRVGLDIVDFQFETNGMFIEAEDHHTVRFPRVSYVVSPKIPHKHKTYAPLRPIWVADELRVSLKYVVTADPDSPYHRLPDDLHKARFSKTPVYVSGMTVYKRSVQPGEVASIWDDTLIDRAATALNYQHAARLVQSQPGLTLSYQTHLFGVVE
jgi:organic radical activating enzyme